MTSPKTLTHEESSKLLASLAGEPVTQKQEIKNQRNVIVALLMLDAGLRVGEVVQLRLSDLVLGSVPMNSIFIRPEISKNSEGRIIPLSHRLSKTLNNFRLNYWAPFLIQPNHFALSLTNHDKPVSTRQVERIIRTASMHSIGRPVHPHILRHTFASRLMRKVNARTVQELLGHSNIQSTQIYMHPNGQDLKNAIDIIDEEERRICSEPAIQPLPSGFSNGLDTPATNRHV